MQHFAKPETALKRAYELADPDLSALLSESYSRAYCPSVAAGATMGGSIVVLQQLAELEEVPVITHGILLWR